MDSFKKEVLITLGFKIKGGTLNSIRMVKDNMIVYLGNIYGQDTFVVNHSDDDFEYYILENDELLTKVGEYVKNE